MTRSHEDSLRRVHLTEELRVAGRTIVAGLGILQRSAPAADPNYFLFMLVLSTGLEGFMKVLLNLQPLDAEGAFLTRHEMQNVLRHDLVKLTSAVVDRCFNEEALSREAVQDDLHFITHDALLQEVLGALSDFARSDRYLYLDGLNDPMHGRDWLQDRCQRVMDVSMPKDRQMELLQAEQLDEILQYTTQDVVVTLERYLRGMSRTVVMSGLAGDVRSLGTGVWPFLAKMDKDLGVTEYDVH